MYKIEKNIPIEVPKTSDYPFSEMEIGDSFLVPYGNETQTKLQTKISSCCSYYRSKHDHLKKFVTRITKDGVRVWRTK